MHKVPTIRTQNTIAIEPRHALNAQKIILRYTAHPREK